MLMLGSVLVVGDDGAVVGLIAEVVVDVVVSVIVVVVDVVGVCCW